MRIKLSDKYQNEREEICNKIITILDLKEDNTFLLCELDEDIEKQNKIMDLKEEIQKYFACSTISSFKPVRILNAELISKKNTNASS